MSVKKALPIDPDLAGVDKALKRAAKSALSLARQTKTSCYVVQEGQVVDIARRKKLSMHEKGRSAK